MRTTSNTVQIIAGLKLAQSGFDDLSVPRGGQAMGRSKRAGKRYPSSGPKGLWSMCGGVYREQWRVLFETQGQSSGRPWPQYGDTPEGRDIDGSKGRYGRFKAHKIRDTRPLHFGGRERLLPSLATVTGDTISEATCRPLGSTYGTRLAYAVNHDQGVGRAPEWAGGYGIPLRPLVVYTAQIERDLVGAWEAYAGMLVSAAELEAGRTFRGRDALARVRRS
jgi:hypothetical protein